MNKISDTSPLALSRELARQVGRTGTRYGCYPPLADFDGQCGPGHYRAAVQAVDGETEPGLSLYVHLPFCYASCAFCHCSKLVTRDGGKAARYLSFLDRDIALQGALLHRRGPVQRMYWGGGTPTYYSTAQLQRIYTRLRAHFEFAPDGEYLIEIDPRTVNEGQIAALRAMGFNIASLGVPDLDADVLAAVTRLQTAEQSLEAIAAARRSGYRTVSVEMMYGLPLQTEATFGAALDRVVGAQPERIVLNDYVHAPRRYRTQRLIELNQLPRTAEKLQLLALAAQRLTAAGYVYVGPDYFVKPDDRLASAQAAGRLHYDMLGYCAAAATDVVPLGASAVGTMGAFYSQNESDLGAYYAKLGAGEIPIARGMQLSPDDRVRSAVIQALLCRAQVDVPAIESAHAVTFERYFQAELAALEPYVRADLVTVGERAITLTPTGRLWTRNLCSVFDRYRLQRRPLAAIGDLGLPASPSR